MYRLLQLATNKWLKENCQLERWGSQFISNLEEVFPLSNFDDWPICQSLFPHTMAALRMEVTD
jgi:hypothetical protein